MHLLAAVEAPRDETVAVDLAQSPGDIVVLSAADTDLACLAAAQRALPDDAPRLRLAHLLRLQHPASIDLYIEKTLRDARLVIVRLLGGEGYWRYGVERLVALARAGGPVLALISGDGKPDPSLSMRSTVPPDALDQIDRCFTEGGVENATRALELAAHLIDPRRAAAAAAIPVPRAGLWRARTDLGGDKPVAAVIFYRALSLAGDLAPIEALCAALAERGLMPLPIFVSSLKDAEVEAFLAETFDRYPPAVIITTTGFALGSLEGEARRHALLRAHCPILQAVLAGGTEEGWRAGTRGLDPRDLAMNVALPEIDGRVLAGALSFKAHGFDPRTEAHVAAHRPVPDRVSRIADLALNWARLARTPRDQKQVAIVLANYPVREGRIGNGVGLDVPASAHLMLGRLAAAGYRIDTLPSDADALMDRLRAVFRREDPEAPRLTLAEYRGWFGDLPEPVRETVTARWGDPSGDPRVSDGAFTLPALVLGSVVVVIQPARGYEIDLAAAHHDPDLAPPHAYLATYLWIARGFGAHAVIHLGKHGTLEWLPGKALALSQACFPDAVLAPLPHLYPFIVNDPGEGTQAKRRAGAVILDHLTPPMTRAGTHGPLAEIERLIDEYDQARRMDARRVPGLVRDILDHARRHGIDRECGLDAIAAQTPDAVIRRLDAFVCDLKELQIRDGLHVFGRSPEGSERATLLRALARVPRRMGEGRDASLIRALARDLDLGLDPLLDDPSAPWTARRPAIFAEAPRWRILGDAGEALETLALDLITGARPAPAEWTETRTVLDWLTGEMAMRLDRCGRAETAALLDGLDGRFVPPGPSGAPTRGKPEVLPTGRNFYSVDTRALPTPAAWRLGWQSAELLIERHAQDFGDYPRRIVLSAWGTSCMRTGGDDIAQALALIGVRPVWEGASGRVTGFEILPVRVMDRPRVDVTLRVSGFFRDAFPGLIDLFDRAVAAVAKLDEPESDNPVAGAVAAREAVLRAAGLAPDQAARRARYRVFGAKPGAYGAGLQGLIDTGRWNEASELAEAYLVWSGYAYGSDGDGGAAQGLPARDAFEALLGAAEAVVHNQDNREHDLLDSDDYYQFEGGLAVAIRELQGQARPIYHNDHALPERPRIRRLEQELARVIRGRATNPRWLEGVRRHGYKGAAEIAATVDYLFAFAATTGLVTDAQFDALHAATLGDATIDAFLVEKNPAARREIAERFEEAIRRGLWRPRSNMAGAGLMAAPSMERA